MKLIDTNVFVYALGRPHEYKESCMRLMDQFERGEHQANVDTELLQEILYHFWQRGQPQVGLQAFDQIVAGFPDPIPITVHEAAIARDLLSAHPYLEPRDAIHAGVVLAHGLEGIISADRDFNSIPGVTRFDPKDL